MYSWIVFLHVISIFTFLLAHGVSASAFFALQRERNPDRIRLLLQMSRSMLGVVSLSLLVTLASGITLGFMGRWWGRGWIWVSLVLLIALYGTMSGFGTRIMNELRIGLGLPSVYNQPPRAEPWTAQELDAIITRSKPALLAAIGYFGVVLIAWLMLFKPF